MKVLVQAVWIEVFIRSPTSSGSSAWKLPVGKVVGRLTGASLPLGLSFLIYPGWYIDWFLTSAGQESEERVAEEALSELQ